MHLKQYFRQPIIAAGVSAAIILSALPAHPQPCPFRASATSALLMAAESGEVVYRQTPQQRLQPASLAKIMTLFLIFDSIASGDATLAEKVEVSAAAARKKGSTMYLREGEKTRLAELIKGIAVVSGNDACIAVAEKLEGGEQAFVDRMNRKAQELGLKNTLFQTADGWPADGQYTTAHDTAMLARAYIETHPQALVYHKLQEFTHADIVLHNRNRLVMQDPAVDGLKTGHIEEAGYHIVATARRDDRRFIAVVMGAGDIDTREREAMQLLEFGFDSVVTVSLFDKGEIISRQTVQNGLKNEVGLIPTEDGRVEVPLGHQNRVAYRIDAAAEKEAPIDPEQPAGSVVITYRDEVVKTIPLVASEKVEQAPPPDPMDGTRKPPAGGENEMAAARGLKAPPAARGTFFLMGRVVLLPVLAVLLLVLLIQWIYIVRLRGRIARSSAADSEVVKQRLEKFIRKH
jgi:D-alanyl-D-alanine carboxypeptidase (penicillin-binding protein 5/6)